MAYLSLAEELRTGGSPYATLAPGPTYYVRHCSSCSCSPPCVAVVLAGACDREETRSALATIAGSESVTDDRVGTVVLLSAP